MKKVNINKLVIPVFLIILTLVYFSFYMIKGKAVDSQDRIHFIAAGADSMIVESNGHCGLIDSLNPPKVNGETQTYNGNQVRAYADAIGCDYFDFVILTHNHYDHNGGISQLSDLITDKTIAFFKEDLLAPDDYEDVDLGWDNHGYYQIALDLFNDNNAKICDVTKASEGNNASCNLSSLNNDFISSVSYDENQDFYYDTNVKENLYFDFGDFKINLYSLYNLAYHHENYNSMVVLVTHKTGGAKAALTADTETGTGDANFSHAQGKSNIIVNPTGECEECINLGIENQISDVIGNVNLLKAAHHGYKSSNSYYALSNYQPDFYITTATVLKKNSVPYPSKENTAAVIYLENAFNTQSYYTTQASSNGALVAQFSDTSDGIIIKDYNSSGNDTNTNIPYLGGYYPDGWHQMNNYTDKEHAWVYVDSGSPVLNDWLKIEDDWYHFDSDAVMNTGFFEDDDTHMYYLCDRSGCTNGAMQTGFQTIDGDTYYFRTSKDNISQGPKGSMITGLTTISNNTYFFREEDDLYNEKLKGSMLKNECTVIDNSYYCFGNNGVLESTKTITPIPTNDICINDLVYNGSAQTLANADSTFTLINNTAIDAGDHEVTAIINNGYIWDDLTNTNKSVVCSISKVKHDAPIITSFEDVYDGIEHTISLVNGSGKTVLYSTDGYNFSSIIPTRINAGITNVFVKYAEDINNTESDISTGSITINKKEVTVLVHNNGGTYPIGENSVVGYVSADTPGIFTMTTTSEKFEVVSSLVNVNANEQVNVVVRGLSAGSGNVNINFIPNDTDNYSYDENSTSLNVSIYSNVVNIPDNSICTNPVYNGEEQPLAVAIVSKYHLTNSTAIEPGNYEVGIVLNDGLVWSDNTTEDKTVTCSILREKHPAPIINSFEGVYDGIAHTISLVNNAGKNVLYSTDGETFTSIIPNAINVGITNVYVKYAEDQYHSESDVSTGSINIDYAQSLISTSNEITNLTVGFEGRILTVSANVPGVFTFTSDSDQLEIINGLASVSANETVDVNARAIGKYTPKLTVNFIPDNENYYGHALQLLMQIDNNSVEKPTAATYCKTGLIYNGSQQTLTNEPAPGIIFSNNRGTNAGSYTVSANVDIGYEWDDLTENEVTFDCSISKASINDLTVTDYNGIYDGNAHSVTVNEVTGGTIKYSTDHYNWQTEPITRTDFGNTTVYVYAEGDNNHISSTAATGHIIIGKAAPVVSAQLINSGNISQYSYSEILQLESNVDGTYTFSTLNNTIDNYVSYIHSSANEQKVFSARGSEIGNDTIHVTFTPDNENYLNYVQDANIQVVENSAKTVDVPTSSSVCLNNLVYDGTQKTLTVSDTDAYEFINNTATNAGEHEVTIRLKNDYKWSDTTSSDKVVSCRINKADLVVPTITGYSGDYDGNPHYITAENVEGGTVKYSLDNNTWVSESPGVTDAGTVPVYVKYIGDDNHNNSSVYEVNIIIRKINPVLSVSYNSEQINRGSESLLIQVNFNVPGRFHIESADPSILHVPSQQGSSIAGTSYYGTGVSVGSTTYTFYFEPASSNYNSISITRSVEVVEPPLVHVQAPTSAYCKENLKYTGLMQTITKEPSEGYTFSNNVQTNVGTYTVNASLSSGYIWFDNTTTDKTFECSILKADSYINFDNRLVVDDYNQHIRPKVNEGLTYTELKSMIDTNGEITHEKSDSSVIATCDTLTVTLDDISYIYTLIISGDVTKTGTVTNDDVNLAYRYLRNKEELQLCQHKAADTTHDDDVKINDIAKLYQYVNKKIGGLSD